ncbi:serine/threonine protein kinase [Gigaspora margarita]|uniref:Serine/threonine protein kinase n=1 Tax=Gigaspora margarita TaxID=4874 RepID=A0A8H4A3Z4_GIGMA|nr:serine/threonine protein kinase [Gigaspora margarita]
MTNSSKLNSFVCCRYFKRPKDKSVKTEQDVLTTHTNNSQVDLTEELKRKKLYGVCKTCGTSFSDKAWCRTCEGQKLQKLFGEWTSGNEYVDKFIRNSQTKPLNKESYLSWIPYVNLSQVRYMANGGFSAVYHALWELENSYLIDVVLKRLHNGCTSDPEFLNEQVTMYLDAASQRSSMIRCYGMTQHPTEGYMLVLEYADEGNLRGYINRQHLLWTDKIYILRDIARALDFLHSRDFVHDLVSDICNGVRPDIDRSIPQFYVDLMTICWDANPEQRPTARVLRDTIENWVLSFDKPIYKKLPPESKDLVKQLKSADTLAKMQFKRQTEEPILLPPPPTHSASVFTSKPLSPFVTASDFQSIRKVSSVVSSTSSLIHVS